MGNDEKKAAIEARYLPVIKELVAKKDPLAALAAVFMAGDMCSAMGGRGEAVAIEKVTTVIPPPRPEPMIEKAKPTSVSPVANPPILLPNLLNSLSLTSSGARTAVTTAGKRAVIGRDLETGEDIAVGDRERCGGFYVLGQPRTGKSNLLISMALQDIKNGHGLLFIDPHTEAIEKIIERLPAERLKDVVYLDPMKKDRSFGINLLHCKDARNPLELERTCGRVREIFAKVWGDERGELGVWLYKVITNAVYILLENDGYTLADMPLLLWKNTTFRNALLKNVTTTSVADFWYEEFDALPERDKRDQVGPAISRLDILTGSPVLKDIIGQRVSTIDFSDVLENRKIVLLRIPANLDRTVKNLIGTIVISELLYEVFERADRPGRDDMPYFGIYCDEFQEFATPDFAKLFTQTGKFRVMPVVAHQTREQFRLGDPNRGATAASPHKCFFSQSPVDAREMPLEFAREPPSETKREELYVISQTPVADLMRGHTDPDIRRFVNKYFRYLGDKRDDVNAEMEGAKFARMVESDTAAFYGAEAQEEGIAGPSHYANQVGYIAARQTALLRARMHSVNLTALHEESNRLRVTMRELDRFLVEVMEGEKRAGQEAFSDFLVNLAAGYSALPEESAGALGLYIKLSYGNDDTPRVVPFELGRKIAFFSGETKLLADLAARETTEERGKLVKEYNDREWGYFYSKRGDCRSRRKVMRYVIAKAMAATLNGGDPYLFLRDRWKEDYGRVSAQVIAERGDYRGSGLGFIYHDNYYFGGWIDIDHFTPQMEYPNKCAVDFCPGKPGKVALDALRQSDNARSYMDSANRREDVVARKKVLQVQWNYFSLRQPVAARTWLALDEVSRWYLLMRSCDLVMYGKVLADRSFPDPSNSDYSRVVSSLVWLFEEHEAALIKQLEDGEETAKREEIDRHCAEAVEAIVVSPPEYLKPRVLDSAQKRIVKEACIKEIKYGPQVVSKVAETIDAFARFCVLFAKPENHKMVRSGQYVEKPVRARAEIDMVNEISRELVGLPRYTAYARVVGEKDGKEIVWKGKVRTIELPGVAADAFYRQLEAIEKHAGPFTRPRDEIRKEIEERQAPWRQRVRSEAPSVRIAEKKAPPPVERASGPEEPMPPSHYESKG